MVEEVVLIQHAGALDAGVILEAHARHLVEAAEFTGQGVDGPFERVQHLLTGDLNHSELVSVGEYLEDVIEGNVALADGDADAAAVDEGDVGVAGLVKISVGAEVAKVRLGAADDADGLAVLGRGLGIIEGEIDVGGGDNLAELFVELCRAGVDSLSRGVFNTDERGERRAAVPAVELRGDLAVAGDVQHADVGKLGAAGRADNVLAVLVLHDNLVGIMAVAVQQGVNAADMGNHVGIGPGLALGLVAQVAHDDDVIGALGAGGVHGLLHGVIEGFAGLVRHEVVNEVAVFILEVAGGGGADGIGGGDADKGDLHAADFLHEPGLQQQLAVFVEVAADVGEVGLFCELQEVLHAVVELMVAGDGRVVAHDVHDVDDGGAFGHGADGLALDGVAVIHQEHIIGLGEVFLDRVKTRVAPALVDAAVDITGEEDDQVALLRGRLSRGPDAAESDEKRRQYAHCEDQRQCFFHVVSSCLYFETVLNTGTGRDTVPSVTIILLCQTGGVNRKTMAKRHSVLPWFVYYIRFFIRYPAVGRSRSGFHAGRRGSSARREAPFPRRRGHRRSRGRCRCSPPSRL